MKYNVLMFVACAGSAVPVMTLAENGDTASSSAVVTIEEYVTCTLDGCTQSGGAGDPVEVSENVWVYREVRNDQK